MPLARKIFQLAVLALISHGLPAPAQEENTGVLRGVVEDPSRTPVDGARVRLENKSIQKKFDATTDEKGEFIFQDLAQAEYLLSVKAKGFEEEHLRVTIGHKPARPLRIRLDLAEISDEVTVSARDLSSPSAEQNIDAIEMDQNWLRHLPAKDGDPLAVPSVFLNPAAMAGEGPKLTIDGIESSALEIPLFSIARVDVNRNPYSAEYGRSGKGRIEVTTRRGNRNHYHGNLSLLLRNSALDARNVFARTQPVMQRAGPEADLYGPLGRRHTFYLAGRYDIRNESTVINAATPAGILVENFKAPERNAHFFGRMDFKLSSTHRLALMYKLKHKSQRDQGVGGFNLPERAKDTLERENELKVLTTSTISPNAINEVRFAFKDETDKTHSRVDRPAIIVLDAFRTGGAQVSERKREDAANIQDIVSLVRGRHDLRFGGGIRPRFFEARDASDFGGTFYFSSLTAFNEGRPFLYRVNRGDPDISYRRHEFHAFFQDQIRLRTNLSLSLGLRHEAQTDLPDHKNFGPRLAFAYSPGSREMVLRGGIGVFYERQPARLVEQSLLYNGSRIVQVVVSNPGFPNPLDLAGNASIPPPSVVRIAPGIRTPYIIQKSFSIERRLGEGQKYLTIEYTGIRGVKLYRTRNLNAPLPGTKTLPDPNFININQFEASGTSRANILAITFQGQFGTGLDLLSQYSLSQAEDDTGGLSSLPADNYNLRGEHGRADFDRRHQINLAGIYKMPFDLRLSGLVSLSSGIPFNITTGSDDNHDTVANDRPPGVDRNTGRGPRNLKVDARLSKAFRLERSKQRPELEAGLDAFNLFNNVNFKSYVGVLSSPFFGHANAAHSARQLQVSLRFRF